MAKEMIEFLCQRYEGFPLWPFFAVCKLRWAKIIKKSNAKDDNMAHNSRTRAKYHQVKIYGSVCKIRKGGHTTNYIPLLWCVMDWKWKCDRRQWENTRVTYLSVDCVVFAWEVECFLFYITWSHVLRYMAEFNTIT